MVSIPGMKIVLLIALITKKNYLKTYGNMSKIKL